MQFCSFWCIDHDLGVKKATAMQAERHAAGLQPSAARKLRGSAPQGVGPGAHLPPGLGCSARRACAVVPHVAAPGNRARRVQQHDCPLWPRNFAHLQKWHYTYRRRGALYNFGCIRCDTCASLCRKNAPSAPNSFTVHDARGDFASCQYANHSEISKFQALKFCVASMTNRRTRGQQSGKRHAEAKQQLSACRIRGAPARFPSHRTGARRAWRYGRPQLREKRTQRAHQR